MSRFFNETQKANQWAQQRLSADLGIQEMQETLKHAPVSKTPSVESRVAQCGQVNVGSNGTATRLVLRQDDYSKPALEAYRTLRTKLMRAQAKAGLKSIAISSSLPGEGKTLTTMNLGLCYAQLPQQRVLVIDADLRRCGLTAMLDRCSMPGLAAVLAGDVSIEDALVATNQKNLYVLPAGTVLSSPPESFTGSRWQELIGRCGELFKVILIDTPPILPLADFELISAACDGVLMVVRARHADRQVLQKTASAVDRKKLLGVVFNGTDFNEKYYGYAEGKS